MQTPEQLKKYQQNWRALNAESIRQRQREYAAANKEKLNAKRREWTAKNKEKLKQKSKEDYEKHKEIRQQKHREWKANNPEAVNTIAREYRRNSEKHKQWRSANREQIAARQREWRKTSPKWKESLIRNREKSSQAATEHRKTETYKAYLERVRDQKAKYGIERYHHQKQHYRDYQYAKPPRKVAVMIKWELCGKLCYICGLEVVQTAVTMDHIHPALRGGSNGIENLMPAHKACNIRKGAKLNYPVVRPDLIPLVAHIEAAPRKQRRRKEAA